MFSFVLPVYLKYTQRKSLQFAARIDGHFCRCSAAFRAAFLHFSHNIGATDHVSEDHVLGVQPIGPETGNHNKCYVSFKVFLYPIFALTWWSL